MPNRDNDRGNSRDGNNRDGNDGRGRVTSEQDGRLRENRSDSRSDNRSAYRSGNRSQQGEHYNVDGSIDRRFEDNGQGDVIHPETDMRLKENRDQLTGSRSDSRRDRDDDRSRR